jgi:hypothetical protein
MAKNNEKSPEPEKVQADTDIQAAAEVETAPAKADAKKAKSTEGLVKMHKDGTHLHVHPSTVDAHKSAGWKLA